MGVRNDEWLYMLQEETLQSLSIEGYFATDAELKAVLSGRRSGPEILSYFRATQGLYDLALQHHREGEVVVTLPLIRHIHSELFRELDARRGLFRTAGIRITGAKITPPEHDDEEYIRVLIRLVPATLARLTPLEALARLDVLFEANHPLPDGNGCTGRILLNYLAISLGWPSSSSKGCRPLTVTGTMRRLEAGDLEFQARFPAPTVQALEWALEAGNMNPLQHLLADGVIPQQDRLLAAAVEATTP